MFHGDARDKAKMHLPRPMSRKDLPCVGHDDASILGTLEVIERSSQSVALVVDSHDRLRGVVTDGDLRRALLSGAPLTSTVLPYMSRNFVTVSPFESRAAVLDLMISRTISHVPVVDDRGRLVGLHTLRNLLGREHRDNAVLILAGGRGTRLGRETADVPKPMLRVAGRPILARLVNHCVGFGFSDITISVSYRADDIISYFGDGADFGCDITYLHDRGTEPRGTGGPFVDLVRSRGAHDDPVLVVNGDLVTDANFGALIEQHTDTDAYMTIAVHDYTHEVPFGVIVEGSNGWISNIEEKPVVSFPVSAGIYALSPKVAEGLPDEGPLPMTEIVRKLLANGSRVRTFRIQSEWVDVGSPIDLKKARGFTDHT